MNFGEARDLDVDEKVTISRAELTALREAAEAREYWMGRSHSFEYVIDALVNIFERKRGILGMSDTARILKDIEKEKEKEPNLIPEDCPGTPLGSIACNTCETYWSCPMREGGKR